MTQSDQILHVDPYRKEGLFKGIVFHAALRMLRRLHRFGIEVMRSFECSFGCLLCLYYYCYYWQQFLCIKFLLT